MKLINKSAAKIPSPKTTKNYRNRVFKISVTDLKNTRESNRGDDKMVIEFHFEKSDAKNPDKRQEKYNAINRLIGKETVAIIYDITEYTVTEIIPCSAYVAANLLFISDKTRYKNHTINIDDIVYIRTL